MRRLRLLVADPDQRWETCRVGDDDPDMLTDTCGETGLTGRGYACVRLGGHRGQHVATDGRVVLAVWR